MQISAQWQQLKFGAYTVQLWVPAAIPAQTESAAENAPPYWAKLWPAAHALCTFMAAYPSLVQNKTVLELGAGIALPSFLAAQMAAHVCCSDASPAALQLVEQSIRHSQSRNMHTTIFNWNDAKELPPAELLLLSDVSYHPPDFDALHRIIAHYLQHDATIILSTPQRLMAKAFLLPLLTHCVQQENYPVQQEAVTTWCSIHVLQQ